MKLTKWTLLFFFIFFAINAWPATSEQVQIQQMLNQWRARYGIPSATLSILLPNSDTPITFMSGTTGYANGQKTQNNTLFQAGSITKSFTAAIILQLEAEKKLDIDDPITKYLPQYPRWRNVTIRELLNHTSGIFNYTETATFNRIRKIYPRMNFSPAQIVSLVSNHRDYFSPGQGWKYSNTNYILAGMIIEKVTGQPLEKVMHYYLHSGIKVNLYNTYYLAKLYSKAFIARMAHGYSSTGHDVTADNMSWAHAAGAIVTTTQDLLIWWRGLFQYKILPPEQMAEMTSLVCETSNLQCLAGERRPHLGNNSIGKGYGLGVIQSAYGSSKIGSVWWHNGSTKGYKALVMWYPKSNIYMALTIDRDPGYLLTPNLPIIRKILNVLISVPSQSLTFYKKKKHSHFIL